MPQIGAYGSAMSHKDKNLPEQNMIAHVIRKFLPITETWAYAIIAGLAHFQSVVFTTARENSESFSFPEERIHVLPRPGTLRWFWQRVVHRLLGKPLVDLRPFIPALEASAPALIHAHFGNYGFFSLPLKQRLGIPQVTTFYGYDVSLLPQNPLWRRNFYELFEGGECFLVEGNFMKQQLVNAGCPSEKIVVQHIGVQVDSLPFQPRERQPCEPLRLFTAATFTEKKGLAYALEAISIARQELPNIELRVLGDGPLRPQIEQRIRELGLGDCVTLLGYQAHDVFLKEAYRAHLFISPSVTAGSGDNEGGSPVSITEVQATGMPVLSTFHCDIPEVVVQGETGLLAPERDAEALAHNLLELGTHLERWPEMGRRAREHIVAEYNLRTQIERLEEIYMRLIAGKVIT